MTTIKQLVVINMKKLLFTILLILFFATSANATTYYVRTDGNDSNDGSTNTSGDAWLTIDHAADTVSAGDVIRVQAGTYEETATPSVEGTSSSNMVTFVADGSVTTCGFNLVAGIDYIRIIGFTIDADYGGCSNSRGISLNEGVHVGIEIWNNTITDVTHSCIGNAGWPSASNYESKMLIIGNTLGPAGTGASNITGIAIPTYDTIMAYNNITDIYQDGIFYWGTRTRYINNHLNGLTEAQGHSDGFQNGSSYVGWEQNLIEANFHVGSGDQADEHGSITQNNQQGNCVGSCGDYTNNVFRGNVWHVLSGGGISVDGAPSTYHYFYNNTTSEMMRNLGGTTYGQALFYHSGVDNHYLYNNIESESWSDNVTSNIQVYYLQNTYELDYNLAYDPNDTVSFASLWTNQSNEQSNADPDFNDYANDDFTLGASSNATGNGGPLTLTVGSGSSQDEVTVTTGTGGFFRGDNTNINQYGGNLVVGDTIMIGSDECVIESISGDVIKVVDPFTWTNGESVYYGDDTTPDIGAYPYRADGYGLSGTWALNAGTVTVTPNDADLVRFVVVYEDAIPVGVDSTSPYTVAGVGAGTVVARIYPKYASTTLWATANEVAAECTDDDVDEDVECDDSNICTTDTCVGTSCVNAPNSFPCDDSVWCNGTDACDGGACALHTFISPCPSSDCITCNETTDTCDNSCSLEGISITGVSIR